jgi:DNA-binding IclR family transcriptional regulator
MPDPDHPPKSLSPAVDRALAVLQLLAEQRDGVGLAELSRALGEAKSSLFTVLNTLEARGFVAKEAATKRYTLGPETWRIGAVYAGHVSVLSEFQALAPELVRDCGETMQLAVLQGRHILYIGKQEGTQPVRLATQVGDRLPAHTAALGKALLSQLPAAELDALFAGVTLERFTPNTITDFAALTEELAETRRRGYAVDRQEVTLELRCVAAPVFDASGTAVAAASISVLILRMDDEREQVLGAKIREFARGVSWRLGYVAGAGVDSSTPDDPGPPTLPYADFHLT